jgi:hypothetical protein
MPLSTAIIDDSVQELADYIVDIVNDDNADKAAQMTKMLKSYKDYLKSNITDGDVDERRRRARSFNDIMKAKGAGEPSQGDITDDEPSETNINDDQNQNVMASKLEAMVSALIAANPTLRKEEAYHYLIHSAHGRRLAEHLNSISKTEKGNTMSRIDELKVIAKADGGMDSILEHVISKGATTYTEHELTSAGMEYCKKHKKAGESVAQAFARYVEATPEFCKALDIIKGYGPSDAAY